MNYKCIKTYIGRYGYKRKKEFGLIAFIVSLRWMYRECNYNRNVLVAQWIRHPPTKREIAGSSPVEDSLFFSLFIQHYPQITIYRYIMTCINLLLIYFKYFKQYHLSIYHYKRKRNQFFIL